MYLHVLHLRLRHHTLKKGGPTNELQKALNNMFYRQEGFKRYIEPKERNQVTKVITVY